MKPTDPAAASGAAWEELVLDAHDALRVALIEADSTALAYERAKARLVAAEGRIRQLARTEPK